MPVPPRASYRMSRLTKGVLKISPIEKSTPPEAEALAGRLYAMLPRIRITDLLAEVATWTLFPDRFTHLRTGETAADVNHIFDGRIARRRAQSRPDPHGGRRAASVALASWHGRRTGTFAMMYLRACAVLPGQPTAAGNRLPRTSQQRHGIVIGWPVLPGWPGLVVPPPTCECPLTVTNPPSIGRTQPPLDDRHSPFYTQADCGDGERGAASWLRTRCSIIRARLPHGDTIPMVAAIPTMSSPYACWSVCSSRRVSRT